MVPSGNVRTGDLIRIASTNATLGGNIQELLDAPLRTANGPTVYLRDVGTITDTTDIIVGYAHVNGKRTVYIPVTKRADASTLDVIRRVRQALPAMRSVAPEDVKIDLVFDQSRYVVSALTGLVVEGLLGAFLTGLMVLVFLRDWRSSLIVVITIPIALLSAVVALWVSGQTINIMTLGGLALAVGVLVDEATVVIENIHTQVRGRIATRPRRARSLQTDEHGSSALHVVRPGGIPAGALHDRCRPTAFRAAVARRRLCDARVVLHLEHTGASDFYLDAAPRARRARILRELAVLIPTPPRRVSARRWILVGVYIVAAAVSIAVLLPWVGTEIFPRIESRQVQLRLREPTGTRLERTELMALKAMDIIKRQVGPDNVEITTGFIGVPTPNYPINTIYLFTSGQHEAVLGVALKPSAPAVTDDMKEALRRDLKQALPDVSVSFEAGDIVSQVMSFGSPTPIEVAVQGPSLAVSRPFAEKVYAELRHVGSLRDLQYAQPLDYPSLQIQIDRNRAGQYGVTTAEVARSLVAATSSSRYTDLNFWRDPGSGNGFQIQVEIPQSKIASIEDVADLPVLPRNASTGVVRPLVADLARVDYGTTFGEVDRYNMQRVISFTANIQGKPLGTAVGEIRQAIARAGAAPRGVNVFMRGQVPAFEETLSGLRTGLILSVVVIFLLLAANFQSFRLAIAVISPVPAVICGVLLILLITGTTLNVQSFMGAIMAIGISVANAILLVTVAEAARRDGASAHEACLEGARGRLRAILMTALAMIAGMIPMALGTGERAQTAPLGRAVIGGLAFATLATLIVLPAVYTLLQQRVRSQSPTLDPDDPLSTHYERRT